MSQSLFCFGYGACAAALARRLSAHGWQVRGTHRTPETKTTGDGVEIIPFSGDAPMRDGAAILSAATHVLISTPPDAGPDAGGDPVLRHHGGDLAAAGIEWAGYLSTTGVYGDHGGGWVSEETPLNPGSDRARRRVAAEESWRQLGRESGVPVHIFRLAGLYGPGRNPLDRLRNGTARRIVKPGQMFSRIHLDDVAAVLEASMQRPDSGAIYNVCDDLAAPPQDVVAYAAELTGVPCPPDEPFDSAEMSPMARSFYQDNKRVRNDRIKDALGVRLAWPTYREGLRALADSINEADSSRARPKTRRSRSRSAGDDSR